ncbi:hypothetical protein QW71_24220 [Paenibacillus sp. IHB B 3415]|uniref:hypothetical protein n=1 Tax=Paenibacillus sp. IHB B 3415 TaxID=867080 RepID=UPI000573F469|nr:hypothetical protein [Paenibacillus sp. IHB B 3415]KHL93247.1 hypothetical protein QW71_24220 [Paenibacillus sp. IHB B 3415]
MLNPKEVHIEGDFWDTILNNNILYLWTMDGTLRSFDWRKIKEISNGVDRLMITMSDLMKYESFNAIHDMDTLPSDIDIYNDNLYMTMDDGLFEYPLFNENYRNIKYGQLSGTPFLRLSIRRNGRIALSAGEEGLFEYNILKLKNWKSWDIKETEPNLYHLSTQHSLSANWIYSSIYSNSNKYPSYLAGYFWDRGQIRYNHIINEDTIFRDYSGQISWVYDGYIYKATNEGIVSVKYHQQQQRFGDIKHISFQPWKGRILSASAAPFGSVIECVNALVIMKNEYEFLNLPGEVSRWRIFSKDNLYSNYLNIVYEDKVSIYMF